MNGTPVGNIRLPLVTRISYVIQNKRQDRLSCEGLMAMGIVADDERPAGVASSAHRSSIRLLIRTLTSPIAMTCSALHHFPDSFLPKAIPLIVPMQLPYPRFVCARIVINDGKKLI